MRILVVLVSILFLALDWLALDDITTGSEPSFYMEYAVLAVSAFWFASLPLLWRRLKPAIQEG